MKKVIYSLVLALLFAAAVSSDAHANSSDQSRFNAYYGSAMGLECVVCHTSYGSRNRNSYGTAYASAGRTQAAVGTIAPRDSDGDTFSNDVEIKAGSNPGNASSRPSPTNRPPVVNSATASPQTATSGATVTLAGSATDPDNNALTYIWTQVSPASPRVSFPTTPSSSPSRTITAPTVTAATTFTFRLTATDTGNLTGTRDTSVTVNPASTQNRAPVVDAGPSNYNVSSGGSISLTGSASDPDAGDTITIAWTQSGTASGRFADTASARTTFTAPTVQTSTVITIQLRATDRAGLSAADSATITVAPSGAPIPRNNPPVANAGLDLVVISGSFTNLDGFYSSDPDDGIASYSWTQVGTPAVKLSDPAAVTPVFQAPADPATLTFRLVVTDKSGLQDSDTVTVTVVPYDSATQQPSPPSPSPGDDDDDEEDDEDDDD